MENRKNKRVESETPNGQNDSSKVALSQTVTKRKQTSIHSFFGGGKSSKVVTFQSGTEESTKSSSGVDFPMTPPTPVSPHTPQTPPASDEGTLTAPSATTPPTEQSEQQQALEIHPFFKKTKIVKKSTTPASKVVSVCSSVAASASSETSSQKKNTSGRPLQQMYLDLGQSNFAKQTICNTCGMLYVHGVAEDAKEHSKMCQEYLKGVPFSMSQQCRIVSRDVKGSIVEVRPSDSSALRNKVKRVKKIVDHDLGFAPSDSSNQVPRTAYLYISNNRILGMATAEIIQSAHLLESSSLSRSTQSHKALAGIHQLWVHASVRKEGIATRLIDTVRAKLVFGLVVPAELVAFSSPTEAGASFARRYARANHVEDDKVLVYDCC